MNLMDLLDLMRQHLLHLLDLVRLCYQLHLVCWQGLEHPWHQLGQLHPYDLMDPWVLLHLMHQSQLDQLAQLHH
jgi:hypothetical protein